MMPRWQRAYAIATCALIAGALAYAVSDWAGWPRLTYKPLTGEVVVRSHVSGVAMTYFGVIAWGLGGAAIGAVLAAGACAVLKRPASERVLRLLGAWAITAILLAGLYFTWTLWPWGL
ncbi:MAG TPA: hypothetical protein VMJ10_25610 [Kofleriaceae bacterium]|nr:hypothetical protein [Kofleriaceae bacterium]